MSNLIKGVIMVNKEMLEDLPDPRSNTFIQNITADFLTQLLNKSDNVIEEALIKNGIDITDIQYLKDHISRVIKEGDKFEHYYLDYGTPNEKRIVSIQRNAEITTTFDEDKNKYTVLASHNYY